MLSSAKVIEAAVALRRATGLPGAIESRILAAGNGWRIVDIVCSADRHDRVADERHGWVSIALVLGGTFSYRGERGVAHLQPGSMLLADAGRCFACGHEHGVGDRCIAFQFTPDRFDTLRSGFGSVGQGAFARPSLPVLRQTTALFGMAEALAAGQAPHDPEALALQVAAAATALANDEPAATRTSTASQLRRIAGLVHAIVADPAEDWSLDVLAGLAAMSPYHFLRCFRSVTGTTPHAYVVQTRLREAARLLRASDMTATQIAFEIGFADVSAFYTAFRSAFDITPADYRRRAGSGRLQTWPGKSGKTQTYRHRREAAT